MEESDRLARRESRVAAVEALFAWIAREKKTDIADCLHHVLQEVMGQQSDDFAEKLCAEASKNSPKFLVVIKSLTPNESSVKIATINQAILLAGMAEIKNFDTPAAVVINEYIDIAKSFGETRSGGFINGVLDAFRQQLKL